MIVEDVDDTWRSLVVETVDTLLASGVDNGSPVDAESPGINVAEDNIVIDEVIGKVEDAVVSLTTAGIVTFRLVDTDDELIEEEFATTSEEDNIVDLSSLAVEEAEALTELADHDIDLSLLADPVPVAVAERVAPTSVMGDEVEIVLAADDNCSELAVTSDAADVVAVV